MLEINNRTIPISNIPIEKQQPIILLAMVIWGEARGCSFSEQIDVGNIIRNRVIKNKKSYHDIILQPYQFSCFNKNDPNRKKLLQPLKYDTEKAWLSCLCASNLIYYNIVPDTVRGAVSYYSGDGKPYWADEMIMVKKTKHFRFFTDRKMNENMRAELILILNTGFYLEERLREFSL